MKLQEIAILALLPLSIVALAVVTHLGWLDGFMQTVR
jgi:hypothetical protein